MRDSRSEQPLRALRLARMGWLALIVVTGAGLAAALFADRSALPPPTARTVNWLLIAALPCWGAAAAMLAQRLGRAGGAPRDVQSMDAAEALTALALLRGLGEAAPFAVTAKDRDLRFTYVNRFWLEHFKLREADVLGRTTQEVLGSAPAGTDENWRRVIATGEPITQRVSQTLDDEKRIETLVRYFPLRDERQAIVGAATVVLDLTRQELLREELSASAERYRMVLELTPNILWSLTSAGGIDYVNERWEGFVGPGHSPEDWIDLVHPDDRARMSASLERAQAERRPWRDQFRLRHKSGEYRWMLVRAFQDLRAGVDAGRYFGSFTEIDELVRAQQQARDLQAEAAHLARLGEIGHMASALAHELNQPLAAAVNYVEGVSRRLAEAQDRADEREALGLAAEQLVRAGDILRRLRDFLRKRPVRRAAEPLEDLVREAVDLALIGAAGRGVRIAYAFPPGPCDVWVDRVQVQQVVLNLVRNAVDAMARRESRLITLGARPADDGSIDLYVRDTGHGLSAEAAARLFTPFATTKPDGMGVGLSICRTIVEAHGGRIWAGPPDEMGATFYVRLPLAPRRLDDDAAAA